MTDTRAEFEKAMHKKYAWNNCEDILANPDSYSERVFLCVYYSWEAWQAATEQSQKEIAEKDARIAELEANNGKVILALASIRDIFEYDDEMVRSGAISFPEDVAGFVKTKVAALQAREKVLVEALESAKYSVKAMRDNAMKSNPNVTSDNPYNLELESIEALLANVRGE